MLLHSLLNCYKSKMNALSYRWYRHVPIPDAESGLRFWQERSAIRYDTAWHEYIRETAVASRKEANGRPADQPQIRLQRWLLAISRASHARRIRREKSVIPTPCYHSRQWLVESTKAPFRWYRIRSLATQIYTYKRARETDLDEGP